MPTDDATCPHCGARMGDLAGPSNPGFGTSEADEGGGGGGGSSVFSLPTAGIVPDPLLGTLAEAASADGRGDDGASGAVARSESFDALGGLNFDAPPPSAKSAPAPSDPAPGDEEEVVYVSGSNWPMLLLGSYASAATLALIWWVVIPRFRAEPDRDAFTPGPPATATRAVDRSRKVDSAAPIPAGQTTSLGRPLRVGAVEVTPLDVSRGDVRLRRDGLGGRTDERKGGSGALALRVRVRNLSDDGVFAPLDPAFLRDRDDGPSDSFVELGSGERVYPFPLSVESEWSIVGEDLSLLRPGESRETRVHTAADFPRDGGPLTWRLRLRTGIGTDTVVGVEVPAVR